jgi:hypothetical protein
MLIRQYRRFIPNLKRVERDEQIISLQGVRNLEPRFLFETIVIVNKLRQVLLGTET